MLGVSMAVKSAGQRMQQFSVGLANIRTGIAAIGFTRGFRAVTTSAFEFQKSLNAVEARTFGTRQEMKKLEKQALSLGASTIFTSGQVADGMKFLAQTGFETNQIFGLMPKMLTLAAAGDLQLAEAADIATNVLKTFGLEIGDMGRVTDVLALAASSSNTDIRQLSMAIRNVGAVSKGVGVDIEEVAALIGVLGDKGIQAGQAGTLLMNAFRVLATEAPKVQKGLMNFGLKRKDVMTKSGELKDFTGLLQVLGEKGATVGQLFDIFSIRGGKAVMALKDSAMSVRELNVALDDAKGTADKMADVMLKHGVGNVVRMQSAFNNLKITIGLALMPVTIWLADFVTKISNLISQHPKVAKFVGIFLLIGSVLSVGIVTLGVMGALIGGLSTLFGALGITINLAFWPLTLVALGIAALIAGIVLMVMHWKKVKAILRIVAGFFLEKILRPFILIKDIFGVLTDSSVSWGDKLKTIGKLILDFILAPFVKLMELWDNLKGVFASDTKIPLDSSASSPGSIASTNKIVVEQVVSGAIDINDKTNGQASIAAKGGQTAMNLIPSQGYRY